MNLFYPVVSIIIPIYNTQKFLTRCIESVLSQSYKRFELILVDDGSTDLSPVICDNYKRTNPCVKVIHKENGGLSSARNAGLDVAVGDYIYFVDSDDYIDEHLLEKALGVLSAHPADCLAFGMVKEDEEGRYIEDSAFLERRIDITDSERETFILSEFLNYRIGWEAWSRIFKADIIREHNLRFVNERKIFAEDLLFSFNYWLYASSIEVLHECPYHYIQRTNSLMDINRQSNNLHKINALAGAAYDACLSAGNTQLADDFAVIYYHLIEWHARPYIVAGEYDATMALEANLADEFYETHPNINRMSFDKIAKSFGDIAHFVSVCIPNDSGNLEELIDSIKHQSLQKVEIHVISDGNTKKVRIDKIHGRYVYILSPTWAMPVDFLEKSCDLVKYNYCDAVVYTDENYGFTGDRLTVDRYINNAAGKDIVALRTIVTDDGKYSARCIMIQKGL